MKLLMLLLLLLTGCYTRHAAIDAQVHSNNTSCDYAYYKGADVGQQTAVACQPPSLPSEVTDLGAFGQCYLRGYKDGYTAMMLDPGVTAKCGGAI